MHKGIVINQDDSAIDHVLAKADKEGNVIMRQGDDYLILNPKMMDQLCDAYARFVHKSKEIVGSLLVGSCITAIISTRLDLWEQGLYGVSIMRLLLLQ